ncbi:hypothetical protein BH23BAC1_BH23BAC1_44840 [soil metagenome]
MKIILITFALIIWGLVSWAQNNPTEEAAIKKVIEQETIAASNRDFKKWIDCFANTPDLAFGFNSGLPTYMIRGYNTLESFGKEFFRDNPEPLNYTREYIDFKIRTNGNTAFVTCIEIVTQPDGSKDRIYKADYLEKINKEWKIIGHIFGQEPNTN